MTFCPIICAILSFILTYVGRVLYADRMARLTVAASLNLGSKKAAKLIDSSDHEEMTLKEE
jgi:hypothetical protein